tara:strand:- start:8422 stop:9471 length:1050 start_codon:yes stop_codon:yes gene_type:complete
MISIEELDQIGKQLSEDFISDNASLNEGLKKVASEKGLNKEQLQRVAEMANTETYLNLLKTAKDNYVQFDLADFREAFNSATAPESDPFKVDDYDKDYEDVATEMQEAVSENETTEKVASATDKETISQATQAATELKDAIPFLEEALVETEANVEKAYIELEKQAKQGILGDTPYDNIKEVIKVAAPNIHNAIVEHLTPVLESYAPHKDLTKTADNKGVVNPQSDFYKVAASMNDYFLRGVKIENAILNYCDQFDELKEAYNLPLQKIAGRVKIIYRMGEKGNIQSALENIFNFIRKHPKTSLLAGGVAVGRKSGKKAGKGKQGEILSKAMQYRERKPKILAYTRRRS